MSDGTLLPLNRTEHMFWATEGYIGGIIQPYLLRLEGEVDEARIRQALRELTTAHPRLRGVIEPTTFSYALRILPDDAVVDQLFEGAFKVDAGVDIDDPVQLQAWHTRVLNEPLQLERGLPWKARWIPHPTRPALIFALHHIVGDGRSLIGMITDILGHLSDQPIARRTLQSPSMVPAVVPTSLAGWPASILGWLRNSKKDKALKADADVILLATRRSPRFTTSTIRHHLLPCTPAQVKALSKQMGTTVNTLLTAVIANTFLARAQGKPGAAAGIRISFDLRRHFPEGTAPEVGNFVSSFLNYARQSGVGVSRAVSAGNAASVTVADYLEWYADDSATSVGLAYLEGIVDGQGLMQQLSKVTQKMPLVIVKGGATEAGAKAAASHTGALAANDRVFDGACRAAGLVRAASVEEAFDTAAAFATQPLPKGGRTVILTTAGGWGVVTSDALYQRPELELLTLPDDLRSAIDEKLPPRWSRSNPVDCAGGETRRPQERFSRGAAESDAVRGRADGEELIADQSPRMRLSVAVVERSNSNGIE